MTTLDIIIIVVVGASSILSAVKGFIRDIFSVIALITGIILAFLFYVDGAPYVGAVISEPTICRIISFAVIFIVVSAVISIIGHFLSRAITGSELSPYDRAAGACFGFLKGLVLAAVILFFVSIFIPDAVTKSRLSGPILRGTDSAVKLLPQGVKKKIDKAGKSLRQIKAETTPPKK
jgi:membrane protein required for colicin V production